jgi:uncharacterized membrane protein YphA (DoxX/SURF4 family)
VLTGSEIQVVPASDNFGLNYKMNYVIKTARSFYALALIVYGIQQFYFGTFRNVFFSAYQERLPLLNILAYLFGVYLVITGLFILSGKNGKRSALLILGIRMRVIALLLALMIFSWFWMVHIPAGIKHPVSERGNLLASAFDALAFSGISILIAFTMKEQRWIDKIENRNKDTYEENLQY